MLNKPFCKLYNNTATRLLETRVKSSQNIKVDFLAFTISLPQLRHCHKSEILNLPVKHGKKTDICHAKSPFPAPPVVKNTQVLNLDDIEKERVRIQGELQDFYETCLKAFVSRVLGFELSLPSDKGFFGYSNSMNLLTSDGVVAGFVAIGGQNNTAYIQITGSGCKHLLAHIDLYKLHYWLSIVLGITKLSRIDLARDDYDNNFNCEYALAAYKDGFFRVGKACRPLSCHPDNIFTYDDKFNHIYSQEMLRVGKRTSQIYWRIYNKKLEQNIDDDSLSWYRSEVELKKWSVDALLNVDDVFAGLNEFSKSLSDCKGVVTRFKSESQEAALDLISRVRHFRRSAGKALADLLEFSGGDMETAIGYLLPDEVTETVGKMGIPPTYRKLIDHVLE